MVRCSLYTLIVHLRVNSSQCFCRAVVSDSACLEKNHFDSCLILWLELKTAGYELVLGKW